MLDMNSLTQDSIFDERIDEKHVNRSGIFQNMAPSMTSFKSGFSTNFNRLDKIKEDLY